MGSCWFSTFTTALKKANSIIHIILYRQGLKCVGLIFKIPFLLSVLGSHNSTSLHNLISSQLVLLTWQKKIWMWSICLCLCFREHSTNWILVFRTICSWYCTLTWWDSQTVPWCPSSQNLWSRHGRWWTCGTSACPWLPPEPQRSQRAPDAGSRRPLRGGTESVCQPLAPCLISKQQ